MKKIIILAALLPGCVTMDKLRSENCEDVINRIVDQEPVVFSPGSVSGVVVMCNLDKNCCTVFAEEHLVNELVDGACYLGDSKYKYKTFCGGK